MKTDDAANVFFIWGIDDAPYGPVELPVLVNWIKDERVEADTWIFARRAGDWQRADAIPELQMFFRSKTPAAASTEDGSTRPVISPGSLRRIKILADLKDAQLAHLADFMEMQRVPQWREVFHQGDLGDAMYFILEGELRVRVKVADKEIILATLGIGEFFGDMALFDHGPRSADVVANVDSVVLRITAAAFDRLTREAPALATPFLQATARTLAARIRADNKRLGQVAQQFSASGR
jgi:CRP-like cAMP-binding protein